MSRAGVRGIAFSIVNYLDELPLFRDEVLPRLERARRARKALSAVTGGGRSGPNNHNFRCHPIGGDKPAWHAPGTWPLLGAENACCRNRCLRGPRSRNFPVSLCLNATACCARSRDSMKIRAGYQISYDARSRRP